MLRWTLLRHEQPLCRSGRDLGWPKSERNLSSTALPSGTLRVGWEIFRSQTSDPLVSAWRNISSRDDGTLLAGVCSGRKTAARKERTLSAFSSELPDGIERPRQI
jgi:hypothetical protein